MRRWGAALFAWSAVALVVASCEAPVGEPRTQLVVVVDTDAIVQGLVLDDPTLSGAGAIDTLRIDAIPSDGSNTAYDLRTFIAPEPEDWPLSFGVAGDEASFAGPVRLRIRAFAGRFARPGELADEATLDPVGTLTIDRLVEIDPPVSGVRTVRVTLRADCMGVPTYFTDPPTTCVDGETRRGSPHDGVEEVDSVALADSTSQVGTWPYAREAPCSVAAPAGVDAVCVPGGFSILGAPGLEGISEDYLRASPPQPVLVSPFFLDRTEMSVGRFRALLGSGRLPVDLDLPFVRDPSDSDDQYCTWLGPDDATHDALPLNCIPVESAVRVCAAIGGSVPTEAQWEYAARGRGRGTLYPWGNDVPSCCAASLSRSGPPPARTECEGGGLEPVGSHPASEACGGIGDQSIDGVLDLAGSVIEVLLDAPKHFDDACWSPANGGGIAVDPVCVDETVLSRSARGGYWNAGLSTGAGVLRNTASNGPQEGFRCAYPGGAL